MRRSKKRKNGILHSTGQRRRNYKRRKKILFFDIILILTLIIIFNLFVKKEDEIPVVEKYSEEHQKQIINEELEKQNLTQEVQNKDTIEIPVPEKQSGSMIINKITMSEIEDGKTILSFLIENKGKSDGGSSFPILLKGVDGNVILKTYIDVPVIKAGQQTKTNIVIDEKIKDVESTELTDEQ